MTKTFVKFFLAFLVIGMVGIVAANAWNFDDIVNALFYERPRLSRTQKQNQPQQQSTPATPASVDGNIFSDKPSSSDSGEGIESLPTQVVRPKDSYKKVRWAPPPPGFLTADTFNYLIYREANPVTTNIKNVLENIHGNLMLDLTPFTLVVKPNKILVMLFDSKENYHNFTHLPSWSGASSDLQSDSMYVVEGSSFYPLSVHELTHLYFDGYFLPTISPLWISEGMAVYMQIYSSKQTPSWVEHSMRRILAGDIIPLEEMTATEDLSSYDTAQAELWYTQSYSLVDYLLNKRTRDEFYNFCNELKNNTPLHQALYRSYGMPFNKVSVLQNVWLHDLQKDYQEGRILQTPPPSALTKQVPPADDMTPVSNSTAKAAAPKKAPAPAPAAKPKPAPQKTQINQLKTVDASKYWGGNYQ